jgi:hypothetical protein
MRRKAVEISSLCLRQAKDLFGDLLATELLEKVPGFKTVTGVSPWNLIFRTVRAPEKLRQTQPSKLLHAAVQALDGRVRRIAAASE